jgi:hypothetical protein
VVDENVSLPFRQYHTPCVSYYIGKHKLVWEITDDVLAKCLGIFSGLEGAVVIVRLNRR